MYLKSKQEADGLYAIVAPVDVVPHEQVVGVGDSASYPAQE